jgi:hypothetical protein
MSSIGLKLIEGPSMMADQTRSIGLVKLDWPEGRHTNVGAVELCEIEDLCFCWVTNNIAWMYPEVHTKASKEQWYPPNTCFKINGIDFWKLSAPVDHNAVGVRIRDGDIITYNLEKYRVSIQSSSPIS